ncbi:MAG: alpha/beta hydrolase [Cyanobacteria bacterium P01_A01_bin.40]
MGNSYNLIDGENDEDLLKINGDENHLHEGDDADELNFNIVNGSLPDVNDNDINNVQENQEDMGIGFNDNPIIADNNQNLEEPIITEPAQFDLNFTRNTVDINVTSLNYVIGGEGAPVVLLHGLPQTWLGWKDIMPELAEEYTVVVRDLPGLGDSSTTPDNEYDKPSLAEDIYQLVDYLDYEEIALIGHDLGGWIAYAYANEYPENVSHLGILEAPIPGLDG